MKKRIRSTDADDDSKGTVGEADIVDLLDCYPDLLFHVLKKMTLTDVVLASQACHRWNDFWGQNLVWLQLFKRAFHVYLHVSLLKGTHRGMMRVIYPGVPMGRIVRKFYGTLYRGCKAFSPCHPVSAALHGNAVKGILPVWGSAIKFEREFLDEFNQIIRFLSLDHVKGKFALKMALENYRNLVDIVEQQEIWDKKGVYLVSYPCRDMGNALKNVEDPIFARLFGIMPAWLKSIIKSVVLTGVFHIQHTYSFKVDAREYHLVCKQCDEWDDDGNLTDVGSWTIFYHRRNHIFAHLGSPTFDECGECDGRVFFEDYYKVKVHYNPEWSFDMYQEFIMDDMDSQALHPVNSLSVLARHCGLDMRLECDRWWWARFIHQITINQLYTLNDIGPPSLGHQCGDEQRFVNYIGEMDH